MSTYLDPTNFSALQFNLDSAAILQHICKPMLREDLGIVVFNYCRTFHNGTRLYLNTSTEWVKYYIAHRLQDDAEHQETYVSDDNLKYALWSGFKKDKVFSILLDHFGWWHGFTIYEQGEGYVDYFDFAARKECDHIINYYLNNIDLLQAQINDFKIKAADLLDPTDKSKLLVPKKYKTFNKTSQNSLLDPEKASSFMKKIALTS